MDEDIRERALAARERRGAVGTVRCWSGRSSGWRWRGTEAPEDVVRYSSNPLTLYRFTNTFSLFLCLLLLEYDRKQEKFKPSERLRDTVMVETNWRAVALGFVVIAALGILSTAF